jgi:hypothetical protein
MQMVKVGGQSYAVADAVGDGIRKLQKGFRDMQSEVRVLRETLREVTAQRDEARANVQLLAGQVLRLEKQEKVSFAVIDELLALEEES